MFEHYDLAEEALKIEKERIHDLSQTNKYSIFEDSRSASEKLRQQQEALFGGYDFGDSIAQKTAPITSSIAQATSTEADEEQYFKILDRAEAKMKAQLNQ
jgi:hypothetical protein